MTSASPMELLDSFTEVVEDFLTELRDARAQMLLVDQCVAKLGGLNAEIGRLQQQKAELENWHKQAMATWDEHMRRAA